MGEMQGGGEISTALFGLSHYLKIFFWCFFKKTNKPQNPAVL